MQLAVFSTFASLCSLASLRSSDAHLTSDSAFYRRQIVLPAGFVERSVFAWRFQLTSVSGDKQITFSPDVRGADWSSQAADVSYHLLVCSRHITARFSTLIYIQLYSPAAQVVKKEKERKNSSCITESLSRHFGKNENIQMQVSRKN